MKSISRQLVELKMKEMSLEDKLKLINDNYKPKGCQGEYVTGTGNTCEYGFGCSFQLEYTPQTCYCLRSWEEEYQKVNKK
jgi:hypothetical protein